jgi:hypothetical protein
MRYIMKKTIVTLLAGAAVLLPNLSHATTVASNSVFFNPAVEDVAAGSTFSLLLEGQNFASGLDGGSVDIHFDPSVLKADAVSVNSSVWNFFASPGSIDNSAGTITFTDFAQFGANTTNTLFDIATFTFTALSGGSSAVSLAVNNNDPFSSGGSALTVNLVNAQVNVSAVPLPGAAWLFGSVLFAGFVSKTRKKGV